jgi:hypothetical protein
MISKWNTLVAAGIAATALLGARDARAESELERVFPREAAIETSAASGLARLPLPLEVLSEVRADLSDVRIFDASGQLVPFAVDTASRPLVTRGERVQYASAKPIAAERHTERRAGLDATCHESFTLKRPDVLPVSGSWDLVLESRVSGFVRDIRVRAPKAATPLARGTVFRLEYPLREGRRLALPADLPASIEVEIEGEGTCLEPVLAFESSRWPAAFRELESELSVVESHRESDRTVLTLRRPAGLYPSRLRVSTTTRTFHRSIEARDVSPAAGRRLLGAAAVFRVGNLPGVEALEVPLDSDDASEELELSVEDGDSPSLDSLRVFAVVEQPSLIFEAGADRVLRFGGGRSRPPRFDLSRFVGTEAGRRIGEDARLADARLGPIAESPRFSAAPALDYLRHAGPELDVRRFSHRRPLLLATAAEGSSHLRLGADELSRSRPDLADLRIADADGRQWPYLVERNDSTIDVDLAVTADPRTSTESRFRFALPATPLELDALSLDTTARYVDRAVELHAVTEAGESVVLQRGRLTRRPGDGDPLRLTFSPIRVRSLELVVRDGNDAALAFDRATARAASADLFVVAPPGEYWLLSGNPELEAPRYEMSAARDLVLALPVAEIGSSTLEKNPRYQPPRRFHPSEAVLWLSIVLAVLVLGGLTLRLARTEEREAEPEGEPVGESTP